jgi:peroxiredoxin
MSKGLEPGLTIPDFRLPDENGAIHSLSELQGDDVMVLMLGRGEHCPRERMHQREMVKFHEWCDLAFTRLVTILPNEAHDVYKLRISSGAHWPYLCDPRLETRTYFEIDEYTDDHHDFAVVPHTLILSPGLKIEKVYVGYWFWGRPSIYRLWDDLAEIYSRIKPDFDPTTAKARAAFTGNQNGAKRVARSTAKKAAKKRKVAAAA